MASVWPRIAACSTAATRGLAAQFGAVSGRTDDSIWICTAGTGVSRAYTRG
ncbi:MAG: hypothetical protein ACLTTD_08355 [Oscillospiraceae bacterium]